MAIPTLLGVSVVVFLLMSVLPGDPLPGLLAQDATAADRAALQHSLDSTRPCPCATSAGSATSCGDFGYSPDVSARRLELLGTAFSNTVRRGYRSRPGICTGLTLERWQR
jgi:ABC-type dipeptide/oligopeptide/nickel transport system permease component